MAVDDGAKTEVQKEIKNGEMPMREEATNTISSS